MMENSANIYLILLSLGVKKLFTIFKYYYPIDDLAFIYKQ